MEDRNQSSRSRRALDKSASAYYYVNPWSLQRLERSIQARSYRRKSWESNAITKPHAGSFETVDDGLSSGLEHIDGAPSRFGE